MKAKQLFNINDTINTFLVKITYSTFLVYVTGCGTILNHNMKINSTKEKNYRIHNEQEILEKIFRCSREKYIKDRLINGNLNSYRSLVKDRLRGILFNIENSDIINFIFLHECREKLDNVNQYKCVIKRLFLDCIKEKPRDIKYWLLNKYNGSYILHILFQYEKIKKVEESCAYIILKLIDTGNFSENDKKIIVNQKDDDGNTLLHIAVEKNSCLINILQKLGADAYIKNKKIETSIDLIKNKESYYKKLVEKLEVNKFLSKEYNKNNNISDLINNFSFLKDCKITLENKIKKNIEKNDNNDTKSHQKIYSNDGSRYRERSSIRNSHDRNRYRERSPIRDSHDRNRYRERSPIRDSHDRNRYRERSPIRNSHDRNRYRERSPIRNSHRNNVRHNMFISHPNMLPIRPIYPNMLPIRPIYPNMLPIRPIYPNMLPIRPIYPNMLPIRPIYPNYETVSIDSYCDFC
ncbi:hypothetical protein ACRRVD_03390 [Candidatus Cardinium hertigii]|uniref:hypothetical protein n=1 Tax=Candidatus Cardinium hertigii TaxID=247481 RepID=UPI003D7CB5E6